MLLYIAENKRVHGYNPNISKQEALKYVNGESCIWIDNLQIQLPSYNLETQIVEMYLTDDMVLRYELLDITKANLHISEHEEVVRKLHINSKTSEADNLINIDMLLTLDKKLNTILEHLGL